DGSFLAQRPPALRKKFPLTHPSLYVLLSSAYPFSACFPRQPFVSKFTKGYSYLFPISTPFYCSSRAARFEPVLLHFDAKYRLQVLEDLFGRDDKGMDPSNTDTASEPDNKETALRSDLLKMHAYRDAIRRSAGAYVIYPGTEKEIRQEYHELL